MDAEIRDLMELIKARIGRFNRIKMYELPEQLKLANTGEWKSEDGFTVVKLDNYVSGSLPKDEHDKVFALEELVRVGGEALIVNKLTVDFPKSMHNAAQSIYAKVIEECKAVGLDTEPELKETVNAMSLQAFGRELIKSGSDVNHEKLGLASGQTAKFTIKDPVTGKARKKVSVEDLK